MARCRRCGSDFTPSAELAERFPGWQPRECPGCYRTARRTAAPTGAVGGGRGGSRGTRQRPGGSGSPPRSLTLAETLERYHGGPATGVFTDGSARPNPGPGGWGAVYVVDGEIIDQAHGAEPHTTNNRMELAAIRAGVELVPAGTPATVHSDSNLAVRSLTEWAPGWKARGWRRRTGEVENVDLIAPLFALLEQRPEIELRWIKAHAGNRWNEYADALATAHQREQL